MSLRTTKEFRLQLYKLMLKRMLNDNEYIRAGYLATGFCWYIRTPIGGPKIKDLPELMVHCPEHLKHKPEKHVWWDTGPVGSEKRIDLLRSIINTMEDETKKKAKKVPVKDQKVQKGTIKKQKPLKKISK